MEDILKKKRIRNLAIAAIIIVIGSIVVVRTDFAFADYSKELSSQILNAEKTLEDAEPGNENGQYSDYELSAFEKEIHNAKEVLENKNSKNKNYKAARKELKDQQNQFQQSANTDVLSPEELEKIKNGKKPFERKVKLGDKEATWKILPDSVRKTETFNPGIKPADAYKDEISEITSKLKNSISSVAVLHNGELPCEAVLSFPYESEIENVQIYNYDIETMSYGNLIRGDVKNGEISFPVDKGGIYIIIEADVKDVKEVGEVLKAGTEKLKKDEEKKAEKEAKKEANKEEKKAEKGNDKKTSSDVKENKSEQSSSSASSSPSTQPESKPASKPDRYVTVEIRCDTIADKSKITNKSIIDYVPSSGVILSPTKVKLEDGDTAYDVLLRVAGMYGIPVSASYSTVYNSAYIEGINHIYEFDGGSGSGWMYKVNGWFPNYGCSNYVMEDNDTMVWCYTCNLGKDVGGEGAL